MSVRELETKLNRRLKEIRRGYAVQNLKRLPTGEYWFAVAMAFNARDMAKVNRMFAERCSLGGGTGAAKPCRRSLLEGFFNRHHELNRVKSHRYSHSDQQSSVRVPHGQICKPAHKSNCRRVHVGSARSPDSPVCLPSTSRGSGECQGKSAPPGFGHVHELEDVGVSAGGSISHRAA